MEYEEQKAKDAKAYKYSMPCVMDAILRLTLEHPNKTFYPETIVKSIPLKLNLDHVKLYLNEIKNYHINVVEMSAHNDSYSILKNGITKSFLKEGGFTMQELFEREKSDLVFQKEKLEEELAISTIQLNSVSVKMMKRVRAETWINIAIGILNVLLLAWQLVKAE